MFRKTEKNEIKSSTATTRGHRNHHIYNFWYTPMDGRLLSSSDDIASINSTLIEIDVRT